MSLVEKAIQKSRAAAEGRAPAASMAGAIRRPSDAPVPVAKPRAVERPDVSISESTWVEEHLIPQREFKAQQTEEYRHIKRQLLDDVTMSDLSSRLLVVTSALPGEGKTFTSANLALSLALNPDYSVLLVDADVIKPRLSRMFAIEERPGLMDCLVKGIDSESCVLSTNIEGLSLMSAGKRHERSTEFMASQAMQDLFEKLLSVPNRIIIVDSLPLLVTTEARALLRYAGQLVLVVRAESTPREAVIQAVSLIPSDVSTKVILNAVDRPMHTAYSGYGYQYGYETGDSESGSSQS